MNSDLLTVTLEIKTEWQKIAYNFALEQHQEQEQIAIFQNTLAILGLQEYLQWGDIETALTSSYSWHPYSRILTGWADLVLPEYGSLMCCIKQADHGINLPAILPLNCIGCVIVQIAPDALTLELQGFIPYHCLQRSPLFLNQESQSMSPGTISDNSLGHIKAIASLFDELYLLTEERLLVEQEMQQLMARDTSLEAYFLPLLEPENLTDIVGRLNRLFYENTSHPKNIFIPHRIESKQSLEESINPGESEEIILGTDPFNDLERSDALDHLFYTWMNSDKAPSLIAKDNSDYYQVNQVPSTFTAITQALTEELLLKLQQLRDECS